jgi:ribulose-phosphate 3-epimerase
VDYAIETAQEIRKLGMTAGIAVRPKTPVEECVSMIERTGDLFSLILIMSVEPGFGGQKFDPSVLPKCTIARERLPHILVEMDGGLNAETSAMGAKAGANVIVAGTSVFASPDPKRAIDDIKRAILANGSHVDSL